MPKTPMDWYLVTVIIGALISICIHARFTQDAYCARCGSPLNRQKCAYANQPAEDVTCSNPTCDIHYIETAYKKIPLS